jgi:hypothetical protein
MNARLSLVVFLAFVLACGVGPPQDIDTKSDACARCRMSIDGLAHAAEIITGDGQVRKYDSLGCLVKDYNEMPGVGRRHAGVWVVDYDTKGWVKADSAYYAMADLPTDHMGFGAAATATREAALKIAGGDAAKVVDWTTLLKTK